MNRNRQQGRLQTFFLIVCASAVLASGLASAAEEDISQNDPPRWYQGADTPQLHYQNLLKEARAAQAQALQECRSLKGHDVQTCRKEARGHFADDKARAQRILKKLSSQ